MLEGRATIQSEPGRLEKWADGNLMKLNKGEILHLEYNSPVQQYRLWDLLAEMTWRSRKKKLNTSQHCALTAIKAVVSWALRTNQGSDYSLLCGIYETSSPQIFTQCTSSPGVCDW